MTTDTQELDMLRDSAADVVARSADLKRLRERRGTLPGFDPAQLQQMADLGWLGLLVPEAHGGLGLGLTEMATVLQQLGRGLMADPLPPVALATRVLCHATGWADAAQRLTQVTEGHKLPVVAWQEGLGGIDPAAISTQAQPSGDGWRLNGSKTFMLVYNLYNTADVYRRFPGGEGVVYVVGGFNASYHRRGDLVVIPKGTPHGGTKPDGRTLKAIAIKTPPQAPDDTKMLN